MAAQSQNSNTPVEGLDEQLQEEVEQVDELSKGTLGSYVKKASQSAADHGMQAGRKQAERDEVDRSTNRHGNVDKDAVHKAMKTTHSDVKKPEQKASKRLKGINTAVKKLTREKVAEGIEDRHADAYDRVKKHLDQVKSSEHKAQFQKKFDTHLKSFDHHYEKDTGQEHHAVDDMHDLANDIKKHNSKVSESSIPDRTRSLIERAINRKS